MISIPQYRTIHRNRELNLSLLFHAVIVNVLIISCTNATCHGGESEGKFIDVRTLKNSSESVVVAGQGYFPVIVGLPSNELFVMLRGGAPHMGIDGRLDLVRSTDSGDTWSAPLVVVDSDKDDRNPAFGRAANGILVLAYHWQAGYDDDGRWNPGPYKQDTKVTRSQDGGKTWDPPELLNLEIQRGNSPFGTMFTDAEGTLYMPIYGAKNPEPSIRVSFDTTYTFLISSKDNGCSWDNIIEVAAGFNEADYLILPNGKWLCAARSQQRDEQAIYTCHSTDQGKTWSPPVKVTSAREHPPDLTLLSDGTILLNFGVRHKPFSVQGLISRDFGQTWLTTRLLFADDLPGGDIGYPSTARLKSGRLVTVYYRAGSPTDPGDGSYPACLAICYDEKDLLEALKKVD